MKKILTEDQLQIVVKKQTEKAIDKLFRKIHKQAQTESGDIDPMQMVELENISEQLIKLVVEQVWQNMK